MQELADLYFKLLAISGVIGLAILYIALSALLYRVPRGGPDPVVWLRWTGGTWPGPGSFFGALIWAAFTGLPLLLVAPWWAWPITVGALMLAEALGWADYWPSAPGGGSFWRLTLRGLPLLNPLMGVIYFRLYRIRHRLEVHGPVLDGWTAYAEIASGAVTATGVLLICLFIPF